MSATKQDFVPLDDDIAADPAPWDAHLQKQLVRNINRMLADLVQPCYQAMYEVAESLTSGFAQTPYAKRVNAPAGAWSALVEPTHVYVPPGVQEVELLLQANLASGSAALAFVESAAQTFTPNLASGDGGVSSLSGTGGFSHYSITAPIVPSTGPTALAVWLQTGGFEVLVDGTLGDLIGPLAFKDSGGGGVFTRPTAAEGEREDWWANFYEVFALDYAGSEETTAGSTDYTADLNAGTGTVDVYSATVAANDYFVFGLEDEQFDGVMLDFSGTNGRAAGWTNTPTSVWEYWNGSAWSALTEIVFEVKDWAGDVTKVRKHILWVRPTDWEKTTVNSNTAYFVRNRVTGGTLTGNTPRLDEADILQSRRPGFQRVRNNGYSDTALVLQNPVPEDAERGSDYYVVGRATIMEVGGVTIYPKAHPGIS